MCTFYLWHIRDTSPIEMDAHFIVFLWYLAAPFDKYTEGGETDGQDTGQKSAVGKWKEYVLVIMNIKNDRWPWNAVVSTPL